MCQRRSYINFAHSRRTIVFKVMAFNPRTPNKVLSEYWGAVYTLGQRAEAEGRFNNKQALDHGRIFGGAIHVFPRHPTGYRPHAFNLSDKTMARTAVVRCLVDPLDYIASGWNHDDIPTACYRAITPLEVLQ